MNLISFMKSKLDYNGALTTLETWGSVYVFEFAFLNSLKGSKLVYFVAAHSRMHFCLNRNLSC